MNLISHDPFRRQEPSLSPERPHVWAGCVSLPRNASESSLTLCLISRSNGEFIRVIQAFLETICRIRNARGPSGLVFAVHDSYSAPTLFSNLSFMVEYGGTVTERWSEAVFFLHYVKLLHYCTEDFCNNVKKMNLRKFLDFEIMLFERFSKGKLHFEASKPQKFRLRRARAEKETQNSWFSGST